MKIACTTLAFPGRPLEEILALLADNGYEGIDFRGLGEEMEVWRLEEFTSGADATAGKIAAAGLEVSAFSSGARIFDPDPAGRARHLAEVAEYARLCRRFGAAIIRVFGGELGETPLEKAMDEAAEALKRMAEAAGEDVTVAVETHDDWTATAPLAEVVRRAGVPNVGVLWDLHHPFRVGGETPAQSYANLGAVTVAVHVKSSRTTSDGKHEYCLPGEGDVPLAEMIALLKAGGYDAYLTLEWEKRWHPELPDPEVALPAYAEFLKSLI